MGTKRGEQHEKWRKAVYRRDGLRCVICGAVGVMHAHHLQSYARNPEIRYAIDNGVTLCKRHHMMFHRVYGSIDNTLIEFHEFYRREFNGWSLGKRDTSMWYDKDKTRKAVKKEKSRRKSLKRKQENMDHRDDMEHGTRAHGKTPARLERTGRNLVRESMDLDDEFFRVIWS